MSKTFELQANIREQIGKSASRHLRSNNQIPAILYGAEKPPMALTLSHFQVNKSLENQAFYSHILVLDINGEKQQAVLKDLQRHPYKPQILHMDFLRINPKEKITMQVPLHFVGAENAPATKQGGIAMHLLSNVEIRCLPADLPEFIEVDMSHLAIEEILHLSQLTLPEGVELTAGSEHDAGVVKIHIPRMTVEEETSAVAATDVPTVEKKDKDKKDKK